MQMYKVKYNLAASDFTEMGEVLVCASTNEQAIDIMSRVLEIPMSRTTATAERVKPSVYRLAQTKLPVAKDRNRTPISGTPAQSLCEVELADYVIDARAVVRASSEDAAIRKAGFAIVDRSTNKKTEGKAVKELEVMVTRRDWEPRSPAIEQQAVYAVPRFFSGGAGRPR